MQITYIDTEDQLYLRDHGQEPYGVVLCLDLHRGTVEPHINTPGYGHNRPGASRTTLDEGRYLIYEAAPISSTAMNRLLDEVASLLDRIRAGAHYRPGEFTLDGDAQQAEQELQQRLADIDPAELVTEFDVDDLIEDGDAADYGVTRDSSPDEVAAAATRLLVAAKAEHGAIAIDRDQLYRAFRDQQQQMSAEHAAN